MAEQSIEERFAQLESRVAELERQRTVQDDRDIALLARIDNFMDDLKRVERVQMRGFETLMAGQQELKADVRELQAGQKNLESAVGVIVETLKDHKQGIESLAGQMNNLTSQVNDLAAGQAQILALLTGQKRND